MADVSVTITLTNREVARLFWPSAMRALREAGLLWSPRAWLFVARAYLSLLLDRRS